jgi:hypothetical protein
LRRLRLRRSNNGIRASTSSWRRGRWHRGARGSHCWPCAPAMCGVSGRRHIGLVADLSSCVQVVPPACIGGLSHQPRPTILARWSARFVHVSQWFGFIHNFLSYVVTDYCGDLTMWWHPRISCETLYWGLGCFSKFSQIICV